jgi:hypothetical protein
VLRFDLSTSSVVHFYSSAVQVQVNVRLTVSRPVCSLMMPPYETRDQFFFISTEMITRYLGMFLLWSVPSDEMTGLQFIRWSATWSCQRCHSWVQVPQDSWPLFMTTLIWDWAHFLSPLTTRSTTVKVLKRATDCTPMVREDILWSKRKLLIGM